MLTSAGCRGAVTSARPCRQIRPSLTRGRSRSSRKANQSSIWGNPRSVNDSLSQLDRYPSDRQLLESVPDACRSNQTDTEGEKGDEHYVRPCRARWFVAVGFRTVDVPAGSAPGFTAVVELSTTVVVPRGVGTLQSTKIASTAAMPRQHSHAPTINSTALRSHSAAVPGASNCARPEGIVLF